MADGIKKYSLVINGIQESVDAVKALNEQLSNLEKRIKDLEGKAVNLGVKTTGGGSKSSSTSALSEEEKLQKQILQTEEKRVAYGKQIYQDYLAQKDLLKEQVQDQKAIAAQERLAASNYTNTIQGMKQELADIKQVMQTVDLGDNDQFAKMVQRANELNTALKQVEESYGQFGRNVGNYSSAFDGFEKLTLSIGGVEREFSSAREAGKILREELIKLEAQGKGNTKQANELRSAYYNLQSVMDDATKSSKAMDEAMDMMQSFTAMASVGNGLKAFFGFDDNEIQKSIQRLVALQGVLQGIETLRKQMETGEGFGKYFSKSFEQVDAANFKLKRLTVSILGTGTAAKTAAIGINALSVAAKALASIGIVAIISAIAYGAQEAFEAISKWAKGNADLVSSEQRLNYVLEATNAELERNLKLNEAKYDARQTNAAEKQIADEKAYAKAIEETNKLIEKRISLNSNNATFANAYKNAGGSSWTDFLENDNGVTTLGGFNEASKTVDELTKRYNALSDAVDKNTGLVYKNAKGIEIAHLSASDVRDELNHIEQFMAGQLVGTMNKFDTATDEGRKALQNFVNGIMNSNDDLRKSILLRLPDIVSNEEGNLGDALNGWLRLIQNFAANADTAMASLNFEKYANSLIDAADKANKSVYQQQRDKLKAQYEALSKEQQELELKKYQDAMAAINKSEQEATRKTTTSINQRYKKEAAEIEQGERYKSELQIKLMRDGLAKRLRQIEEEQRQEMVKAKKYNADTTQIQAYYDKKKLEEKRNFMNEMKQTYQNFYNDLRQLISENENLVFENTNKEIESRAKNLQQEALAELSRGLGRNYSNYGAIKQFDKMEDGSYFTNAKKRLDITQQIEREEINLEALLRKLPEDQEKWNDKQKESYNNITNNIQALKQQAKELKTSYGAIKYLRDNNYAKSEGEAFKTRFAERERYYAKVEEINKKAYDEELENYRAHLENLKKEEKENASQRYVSKNSQTVSDKVVELDNWRKNNNLYDTDEWKNAMDDFYKQITESGGKYFGENGELAKALREGKLQMDEFFNLSLQEATEYREKLKNIDEKYFRESDTAYFDYLEKVKSNESNYYSNIINEFEEFAQNMNSRYGKQPVINNFQIVNIAKTKKNLNDLENDFNTMISKIANRKQDLQKALDLGNIDFKDFQLLESKFNYLENRLKELNTGVQDKMKDLPGEFIASINNYVTAGLQGIQTIMNSFFDLQDYENDKLQNELDKENQMLSDRLKEQEDIVNQHKNAVQSIEDELATSRGDRRQHLIDQLNAQTEAMRAAQKEEERINKQKEANERKQEQLEKKRRKQEYERNLTSILISTAMATANGLATQPFVPVGIAMGALATTLGMVQYALAAKQKPYAKGGQLDGGQAVGPRHRDGGIPVLGGRASIEGGEYITNRVTTQMNAPLLEFINSKKKKIDVSDLLEFYSSGSIKKNFAKVKSKYAEGGSLPTLGSLDIQDQLQNVIVNQDDRPIYVTVTEIENKMEDVRYVKALAGLSVD